MNVSTHKLLLASLLTLLFTLTGCENPVSGDVLSGGQLLSCDLPLVPNASGTECVEPPPLDCEAPTVPNETNDACVIGLDPSLPRPTVFPQDDEAVLYYNRPQDATNTANDPVYEGYRLHTWNNDRCDAYADESIAQSWSNGLAYDGIDPNYGAYWILKLKPDYGDCANFIIHIGTDDSGKELGGGDWSMSLVQDDPDYVRVNFTLSQVASVFEYPILSLGEQAVEIKDISAHWLDSTTFLWDVDPQEVSTVKLHHSETASIEVNEDDEVTGSVIELSTTELSEAQRTRAGGLADWPAFTAELSVEQAKALVKQQLVMVGYNTEGAAIVATKVQAAKVLDSLYTMGDADADEAELGVRYQDGSVSVSVWAPTAQSVTLNIYSDAAYPDSQLAMTEDSNTGIWSYSGDETLDRKFYRFEMQVYHPQNDAIETLEVTDPYSVSLSTNGEHSQFVNLADPDLFPEGWSDHSVPSVADPEDAVIYEAHVRDFSALDSTVSADYRGKYLAFTETGSAPMLHLSDLTQAGVTHLHLLPTNDIASVNEDENIQVDLHDTIGDLCRVNADADVCGSVDEDAIIQDVLASYSPLSEQQQALVNDMRNFDSFNWGYDPKHFNVPDGVYATDPAGVARIKEFRAMVKALHETGLRVVLDVVYNHTNSAGLWDNSVLDKVVPGYYHRRDPYTGAVQQSTCCNDTALEHVMMDKLMSDSLALWTEHYAVDGFRFDIMSHGSKQQMLAARERVQAIDPDNYFYGEGWYRDDGRSDQANQDNMAGTEIATFNDRQRDAIRYAGLFKGGSDPDFNAQDIIKLGMTGQLANYILESNSGLASSGSSYNPAAYALDPADVINYVSKHDNETLWDMLQFQLPFETSLNDRVRIANVSAALPLMSQGIPFLQLGGDMLRSKSMDKNSYDSGDWFNRVDYTMLDNNWNKGLPLEQDNGWRWYPNSEQPDELSISSLAASPYTQVGPSEISFAHAVFKEFLSIRRDSKLFRLTTEQAIIDRVGFHNIGSGQTHGVIVMSIDDGIGFPDLDPAVDAVVVMVNGSDSEQSHTVPTADGFELHPTLAASIDSAVANASFTAGDNEGTFTVPARTMAVFVKPQGSTQGEGLSAYATSGEPDVVPYGDTVTYIRGDMNSWTTDDALEYLGDGVYRVAIDLNGGQTYNFKFASEDWSTVNFGAQSSSDNVVTPGEDKALYRTNNNLVITPSEDGTYFFEVDASEPEAPILHVRNSDLYAGTAIYIRGDINGWSTDSELVHQGEGVYKVIIDIPSTGEQAFKVASADWSTVDLSAGDGEPQVTEDLAKLLGPGSGMPNMTMNFTTSGEYTFLLDASNPQQQYLSVHQTQMYGDQPIYLRGSFNGWGTADELVYQGDSIYSVDLVLSAGEHQFKFANADWSDINYGANGDDQTISLDVAKRLYYNAADIRLSIDVDGTYRFTVTGPDDSAPSITVSQL